MVCAKCRAPRVVCRCGKEFEALANAPSAQHETAGTTSSTEQSKKLSTSPKASKLPELGNPGDKAHIIFKRYLINEQKRFNQYTGFDLYSFKTNGDKQIWQVVKETDEIEGKNNFFKVLFGANKQGEVYYLNNTPLRTAFNIPFNAGAKKFVVHIQLSLRIDSPAYFLDQHKGYDSLQISQVVGAIYQQLRGYLQTQLQSLIQGDVSIIDFSNFNTGLEQLARQELDNLCLEVVSFSISGEVLPDVLQEEIEEQKRQIDADESIETHQMSSSTNIGIHSANEKARLHSAEIDTQKIIVLKDNELSILEENINQEQSIKKVKNETDVALERLYGEGKLDKQGNSNKSNNLIAELEHAGIERKIKMERMGSAIDIHHAFKVKKEQREQASKKAESEAAATQNYKGDYSLNPFDKVIIIHRQEKSVSSLKHFGRYFWSLVASYSPEADDLIQNGQLHYIRYEDPYCNDLSSILLLHKIFDSITGFNCFKQNSERHLVFGKDVSVYPSFPVDRFEPYLRNKFLIKLLKTKGHISVSSKDKTHDRDMALVFSDGAHINLKLTYGLAFWQIDTESLSAKLSNGEKKLATSIDLNADFIGSASRFDSDVECHEKEKNTVISVWGWKR